MILKVEKAFSAAHFYHQPLWNEERNRNHFGKCFSRYGHGHDYKFEIEFELSQPVDQPLVLKICEQLQDQLDHRHLNFDLPDFQSQIPTTENICLWIAKNFSKACETVKLKGTFRQIRLFETPEIWVELPIPAN